MFFLRPRRLVISALLLVFVAVSARLFLFPSEDNPGRADAVVVLAGARKPRLARGLELMRSGVAPVLVISDGRDPLWPQANRLCRNGGGTFRVVCFRPDPYNTRGEAEAVGRLARRRGWGSVLVVTSTFHVTRARMLFERCIDGEVDAVGAPYAKKRVPKYVLSEWVKLSYALTLGRDC